MSTGKYLTLNSTMMFMFQIGLKSAYAEHCKTLGETGHGLVTDGHAGELHVGSNVANAWGNLGLFFSLYISIANPIFRIY